MYAIIRDRGMQYRVEEGQIVEIALLDAEPGSQVELGEDRVGTLGAQGRQRRCGPYR